MTKLWANRGVFWTLVGVIAIAVTLRVWALDWGLPYLYDHDETQLVMRIQHIFKTGDLNPHQFAYGSLFFYLNALAYIPFYLIGWLAGVFHSPSDIAYPDRLVMAVGVTSMPSTYLLGRGLTLLFGVASTYLVFLIGKRVTGNATVGLLAAFIMAVSPTSVAQSRTISPNMFLVFFILLTVWSALKIYYENSTRAYILAGLAAGLTVSIKFNGALILGIVILAAVLGGGWAALKNWRLYAAFALSLLAFILTSPFAVLDYQAFILGLTTEANHYLTGHFGMEGDTIEWYAGFLLTQEGLVSVLGWIGAVVALATRSKPLIIVASFPIIYGIFISSFAVRNDHTILPLLPFLYILAAFLIVEAIRRLQVIGRGLDKRIVWTSAAIVVALLIVWPLNRTAAQAIQATSPDSRLTGVEWIKENIPPGSKVGIESGSPYLDPQVYSVQPIGIMTKHDPDWYVKQDFDYLIFAAGMFERFYRGPDLYGAEIAQYNAFFDRFPLVVELNDGGYVVKIYKVAPK